MSAVSASAAKPDVETLSRRVRIALGQEPGDLLLRGGQVVNVFTETVERADVVIADGWVAGVGAYEWQAQIEVPLSGHCILPGLIDAHMHLESTLLTPHELARVIVPRGTTAIIADPHEIANVMGAAGVRLLIEASSEIPLDIFFMVPSCVPASSWESPGATLDADAVAGLLQHPRVLGLAEMMNFPGVLAGDPQALGKIAAAITRRLPVDGHAPGVAGRDLVAYAAAGISSDHESTAVEEAMAKASLGMLVQVREGSGARNLGTFLPLLAGGRLGEWCLATDDIHVDDLMDKGHLDELLRRVVACGVPAARAARHASLVPARHYGLTDRGAVAPGYLADLLVVRDLTSFEPHVVVKSGKIVARDGVYLPDTDAQSPASGSATRRSWSGPVIEPAAPAAHDHRAKARSQPEMDNSIHIGPLDESAFELRPDSPTCPVIGIIPDSIVTKHESGPVWVDATGRWVFDPTRDISLVACIERHHATGRAGLGLARGLGFRRSGALGSSVAHDAHNLVVTGTGPREMLKCVRALQEMGGGLVVVGEGSVLARLPLSLAGLISTDDYRMVRRQLDEVNAAARALGCTLPAPFVTLSFLCLSVIPELRITDRGVFDVAGQRILPL